MAIIIVAVAVSTKAAVVISRPVRTSIVIKRDRRIIKVQKAATGKLRKLNLVSHMCL
jgi:hypothetical protein